MNNFNPAKKNTFCRLFSRLPWFSIKSLILLWFTSLFVIILLSYQAIIFNGLPFSLFDGWNGVQQFQAIKSLNLIADLKKQQLYEKLNEVTFNSKNLAINPFLIKSITLIQAQKQLNNLQNKNFFIDANTLIQNFLDIHNHLYQKITIADTKTGSILLSTNHAEIGINISEDDSFIQILKSGSFYISDIKIKIDKHKSIFQIGHTIKNKTGKVIAVLILDISIKQMLQPFLHVGDGLGKTGEVLLVNSNGILLTALKHPLVNGRKAEVMKFKMTAKPATLAAKGFEGVIKTYDYRNELVLAAYRHIRVSPEWAWSLVVKIDDTELFKAIYLAKHYSFAILVFVILILITSSFYVTRWLTLPLQRLTKDAEKVAEGDYSIRSHYKSRDEVGTLAKAFNLMTGKIENARQEQKDIITLKTHDLEASRLLFKTMFNKAPLGIALIDSSTGAFYEVNEKYVEIIGKSQQEMKNIDWMSITHPDDIQKNLDNMALLNQQKISGFNLEKRYFHTDGSIIWVNLTVAPLQNKETTFAKHLMMVEDISERKQMEESMQRTQKMEALGSLTGGIAHDFNNLLGIVQGNLEILERALKEDTRLQKRVEAALKGVHRGAEITQRLLKFSRPKETRSKVIRINKTIEEMEILLSKSLMKKINMKLLLAPELWLTDVNEGDLQDAILNLVINARDAMPESGNLLIETSNKVLNEHYAKLNPDVKAGEYVQIAVSDTGQGINKENISKILEPFFTTKVMGKGTGLGLSMVYGFIKRSNGHIKIYSKLGHGTSIHIFLPRVMQNDIETEKESLEEEKVSTGYETILVVDDEQELIEIAQYFLEDIGYHVLTANNSTEALKILSTQSSEIDLVFSDIVMPGSINGFELAKLIVNMYPYIAVLLTSGFTDKAFKENSIIKWHVELLEKPYSKQKLVSKIRYMLNTR